MIYLGNHVNRVRTAVLSALNVVPSEVVYRTDTDEKIGGGSVGLSGSYTGASDATFDVRIAASASSTPRVSAPIPSGVGNGTLSGLAVTGVDDQQFTVTLEDLGTRTRAAYVPFQSVMLFAQATGPGGNAITLTIDASGLTDTPTDYATQGEMRAGVNEYIGDEWDFGAATLNIDGTIPATAPRIRFGYDPQVYRAYRKYVSGQYVHGFSPAPVRDVRTGTPVYSVSGSRSVRITDGTTTDTLTGIVSIYDCLAAIRDSSTLARVEGVIANDKLPGGQGVTELSVWTQPYLVALRRDGTSHVKNADIDLTLGATVPTQTLILQCVDTQTPGAERWSAIGDVTGVMPDVTTGIEYTANGYTLTIPVAGDDPDEVRGSIRIEYYRPSNTDGSASLPSFEAFRPVLGAAARNSAWEFEYRPVPADDCEEVGDIVGGPSAACLGLNPGGGDIVSDASLLRRRQRLAAFVREFVGTNTNRPPNGAASAVQADIEYAQQAAQALQQGLVDLGTATALVPDLHLVSTDYAADAIVTPGNGYRYGANVGGTSDSTPPTWPTTVGATVADNDITWENLGKVALGVWDDALTVLIDDAEQLRGMTIAGAATDTYALSTAFAAGVVVTITDVNGLATAYFQSGGGTSGGTTPTWGTATDIGDTVTDNTITWTRVGGNSSAFASASLIPAIYYQRYETAMIEAKAAAGLTANFTNPSNQGDGCWGELDMDHHWAYLGTEPYAPMYTGIYYHASLQEQAPGGGTITRSTQEFGFGPRFGCVNLLEAGDRIRITISGVQGRSSYQNGDRIEIQSTRASPLAFGGGQTGDDTLTFSVIGSVDGRLDDYELDLTAPAGYSDGGVSFTITPGAIEFALGDLWAFSVESAQFEWRKDAGSWSTAADIPTGAAVLSDGLSAVFTSGVAPSWEPGDMWTFAAESINGVDRMRQPTDGRLTWTGSTTIEIEPPTGATAIEGLLLGDHTIPSDATITLQGSDDNFSTTPFAQAIAWRRGSIWAAAVADYAKYRIVIDRGGSMSWPWMGIPVRLQIRTGHTELGRLVKRERLPGLAQRRGLGGTVEHEALTQASVDALLEMLEAACSSDRRRVGIVPVESQAEAAIVEYVDESLEVTDLFGYQPMDPLRRKQSVTLNLAPIA